MMLLSFVAVLATTTPAPPHNPCASIPLHTVIAHRGASYDAPEETRAAFERARDVGADYLEMDIQRTKDGRLIALHDTTFFRTTNIATVDAHDAAKIASTPADLTLAEIQTLDAGSWFNNAFPDRAKPAYVGQRVLSLDEILDLADAYDGKPRARLYIETKEPERYPGIEQQLVSLLEKRGWLTPDSLAHGNVVFQSFSAPSLKKLALLAPNVPRVFLVDEDLEKKFGSLDALVDAAHDLGCGIGPRGSIALQLVGKAHERGLVVHPWVLDSGITLGLANVAGVDGVFTNRPDVALGVLKPKP